MRSLVGASGMVAPRWLGVQVPREWNVDADRRSHPTRFQEVADRLVAHGWLVRRLDPPGDMRKLLEQVVLVPLGRDDSGWEEALLM